MAELLNIINNYKKKINIKELMNKNIAIEIHSEEDLIEFIDTSNRNGFNCFKSKVWNLYVEKDFGNDYNGSMCVLFCRYATAFCDTDYFKENGYEIYQYKDIELIDRVLN